MKNSKNKLFPFAVREIQDFRVEIGQESPKQRIMGTSSKSVIPIRLICIFTHKLLSSCFRLYSGKSGRAVYIYAILISIT